MSTNRSGTLVGLLGGAAATALFSLVPQNEGTIFKTYKDPVGVLTYCTGATENAVWGKTYTPQECAAQLERDLQRHAQGISKCVDFGKLTDGQKVAFVDTAYNIGVSGFCKSSMAKQANAGNLQASCDALMLYDKAGGKVLPGLLKRRSRAREICLKSSL